MAICENCFNRELCSSISLSKFGIHIIPQDECCNFKDRSRFVELPCKHGDTLFRIKNGKIEKGIATVFFYGSEFQIVNCRFPKISTSISFHRFGKTVFLTKEQAEQALKESEKNGKC